MTLVEATPRAYVEKGSFQIPAPEEVSGVTFPVVANGRLYLRDNSRLFCYDVRANALSKPAVAPKNLLVALTSTQGQKENASTTSSRTGVHREPDAIFVATPGDIVKKMLEAAN